MSLRSQLSTPTGSNLNISVGEGAEAPKAHATAEGSRDLLQKLRFATSRTRAGVYAEHQSPTLTIVTTSDTLPEAVFERLPTPREDLLQTQTLQAVSQNRSSRSPSHSSQSLTEDDAQSTNGTSHAAPVSSLDIDDWEVEDGNLFYRANIHALNLRKLDQWRLKLVSRQLRLRELRRVLRRQRVFISEQQSKILQELRILVVKGGERNIENLLGKLQEVQSLLENLQNQEEQYDTDEKLLIDEQWKVRDGEEKFFYQRDVQSKRLPAQPQKHELDELEIHEGVVSAATESVSSETGTLLRRNPPSFSEMQSVRIRLEKLKSEHCQLLDEEKLRNELGLTLDEDSTFALRVFPLRQAELLHYLEFCEEQVAERQAILDDSFDQFPVYQYTGHDLEVLAQENGPDTTSDMFAIDADDTLVSQDTAIEQMPCTGWVFENKGGTALSFPDFAASKEPMLPGRLLLINDWLLHILRCSSFALFQLALFLQDSMGKFPPEDFQMVVLSVWYHDETSQWYLNSVGREAQSLDATDPSQEKSKPLQPAFSDPNLFMMRKRTESRGQSKSLFASRTKVRDIANKFKGLGLAD